MTNNDKTSETGFRTDGINTDSTWMYIIILLALLAVFPSTDGMKAELTEVIKGADKTIEEFKQAEEVKANED